MKCHFFTILSAISLLLCVATCLLWARSYQVYYFAFRYRESIDPQENRAYDRRGIQLVSADGHLALVRFQESCEVYGSTPTALTDVGHWTWGIRSGVGDAGFNANGGGSNDFAFSWQPTVLLKITYGPIVAVCLLPILIQWVLRLRNKPIGLCATCGYDLRATPDRCPECGTVAAKK